MNGFIYLLLSLAQTMLSWIHITQMPFPLGEIKEAPKRKANPLEPYIRSFKTIIFINSPEGQGKLLNFKFTGGSMTMPKYQNPPFWSIEKLRSEKLRRACKQPEHLPALLPKCILNTF
jgi:hypothetical protein